VNGQYDPEGQRVTTLRDLLFNSINLVCEPTLSRLDSRGSIEGILTKVVGGNLTLVETSISTSWQFEGSGNIIFLENVGEAAYSIERSLDHMKQAGIFSSVAGCRLWRL
jgi:muramoyltetrapeptide carboxypeptidase